MAGLSTASGGSSGGSNNKEFIFSVKINYKEAISKIADLRQQIDNATKQQKQWKQALAESEKELKRGTITQEEFAKRQKQYQEAVSASKIAVDEYKKSMRDIEKQVKNQIADEKKQEGSLNQLRAALSKATKAYDEMSRAERNSAKGQELKKHINDITKELKDAEFETERYYRNVGNYKNAILEAIGVNGAFGNSVAQMAAGGVKASTMMETATASVKAFGAACWGLMTNPIVMALAGVAGAGVAFKWWYDYNQGLAEATRLTREFTGETGTALEGIVSSIQATADVFGKDYLEVLQSMDGLMAQFNISADEAMKAINDGFEAGADLSGNFLANIQQYAPIFKDAGLSAEQMVAIIAQTRSGIFSQGGLDAISMASKRIREMATGTKDSLNAIGLDAEKISQELSSGMLSTFDVVQQIAAAMKNFGKDSQEVGDVIKDVFGKQGAANGIEMLEMLDEMTTSIDEVKEATGEYGEKQEEIRVLTEQINGVMNDLFLTSNGGWEDMKQNATIFAKKSLLAVMNALKGVRDWFVRLYNSSAAFRGIASTIGQTVVAGFKLIGNAAKGLFKVFEGLGDAIDGVFNLDWNKIKQGFRKGLDGLGQISAGGAKVIIESFNNVKEAVNSGYIEIGDDGVPTETGGNSGGGSGSGGSGGKGNGKGGGKKGGKGSKKSGGKNTSNADKEAEKRKREAEKAAAEAKRLAEQAQKELEQTEKARYEQMIAMYDAQLKVVADGSEEQKRIEIEKLDAVYAHDRLIAEETILEEGTKQATLLAMEQKYAADRFAIIQNAAEHELTEQQKLAEDTYADLENQARLHNEQSEAIELARLLTMQEQAQLRIDTRQHELEQLAEIEGLSAEQRAEKEKEINEQIKADRQAIADAEVDIEVAKNEAIAKSTSALGQAMQDFASENTAFAKMGKVLALGELAINTGKALSSGISSAMSLPFPANIAAMATTIASVLANIATAKKTIQSAHFATGGSVEGAGTGTSDSIPAMLSNGESVINARSTGAFAPILSTINQMGGGVPIGVSQTSNQAMGEEMLARAVAKGVSAMRPVVSVEEINSVNHRVEVLENIGNIG